MKLLNNFIKRMRHSSSSLEFRSLLHAYRRSKRPTENGFMPYNYMYIFQSLLDKYMEKYAMSRRELLLLLEKNASTFTQIGPRVNHDPARKEVSVTYRTD